MTHVPAVRLEQSGAAFELLPGSAEVEVLEGAILGFISASSRPSIELDDAPWPISWHQGAKLAVWSADLTNQVGFHRLAVHVAGVSHTYDFRTRTAKATWDEVRLMAEICATAYLGYRRQFTYMAANGTTRKVRLPQIHFAWLRDRLPEIERLVRSIDARPATSSIRSTEVSQQSKGLSVALTSRLLREKHHLLELADNGPIQVAGRSYWPSRVVVHAEERQSRLEEHAQIAVFLNLLATQCQDLATVVAPALRNDVHCYAELAKTLRCLSVFRNISDRPSVKPTAVQPTNIQRTDRRYGRMRELQGEYGADIADSMDYVRSIRANVRDVSDVYQTFVAHVVGNALGLDYFSPDKDLRKRSPQGWSMSSAAWRLYFDTKPPKNVLASWRDATPRPADERPDIMLIRTCSEQALLLDAKFKVDTVASRAMQVDLFKMQGYLNSFSATSGGIIFPGPNVKANVIASDGNALLELPIRANHFQEGGADFVHSYIRDALRLVSI